MAAWEVSPDPVEFEDAVQWFRARVPVSDAEWRALGEAARRRAFSIAQVNDAEIARDVFAAIDKAIEKGTSFEEFQEAVAGKLQKAWNEGVANPGWRIRNLFRTNVQSAYAAGRYRQQRDPDVMRVRPYWLYDAVLDSSTSVICRSLHGTLLPADHPFWNTHYPPNHFGGCRSGVRTLSRSQAQRLGGVTTVPMQTPDAAFAHAPDLDDWQPDLSRYPAELQEPLRRKLEG